MAFADPNGLNITMVCECILIRFQRCKISHENNFMLYLSIVFNNKNSILYVRIYRVLLDMNFYVSGYRKRVRSHSIGMT